MSRFIWMLLLFFSFPVLSTVAEPANDVAVEKRVAKLAEELRCLVCQNQSLADSESGLAGDLRREIRVMVADGKNDKEIIDFLVQRYGDFVRYRPPVKASTLLLWFGPFALLALAGMAFYIRLKRRIRNMPDTPLSTTEREQLDAVLNSAHGEKA